MLSASAASLPITNVGELPLLLILLLTEVDTCDSTNSFTPLLIATIAPQLRAAEEEYGALRGDNSDEKLIK